MIRENVEFYGNKEDENGKFIPWNFYSVYTGACIQPGLESIMISSVLSNTNTHIVPELAIKGVEETVHEIMVSRLRNLPENKDLNELRRGVEQVPLED